MLSTFVDSRNPLSKGQINLCLFLFCLRTPRNSVRWGGTCDFRSSSADLSLKTSITLASQWSQTSGESLADMGGDDAGVTVVAGRNSLCPSLWSFIYFLLGNLSFVPVYLHLVSIHTRARAHTRLCILSV